MLRQGRPNFALRKPVRRHLRVPGVPRCPKHTIFNDGKCVPLSKPACPPGVELNGRVCVTEATPYCPPPTVFQDKACVSKIPSCVPRVSKSRARSVCPNGTLHVRMVIASTARNVSAPRTQAAPRTQPPFVMAYASATSRHPVPREANSTQR
jgi:hypothetical protein